MGLLDNLARSRGYEKAAPAQQKGAADIATGGSWGEIFGGASGQTSFSSFNSQKEQLAAYVDWVYAATRYIAETCATIDLRIFLNHTETKKATLGQKLIYQPNQLKRKFAKMGKKTIIEKGADGKLMTRQVAPLEEIESHPLLDLLDAPNPYMTRIEFFEMTFLHLELAGEAFWAINRKTKNGPPAELWPLMPNLIQVVADPEKFIIGYKYTVNGEELPFAPEDIIHHKYSNPNDMRRGMSPVQAAARIIDTDTHMADHNRRIFYNGATVDAVLYTDQKLNDENWKRLNSQWADKYSGSANAHKTAILENGLKYQPMALNNKDLDFLAGMNYNRDMILAIFGVPKSLLGMDESMSRANAEAAEYGFSKNKIRPKMLRLTSRITEDLAIQFADNILLSFTDPVPDDKEFLLQEKQASIGSTAQLGWRTQNEIRAEDGDDPVEGGDQLWIEGTMVPMARALEEPVPEEKPAVAQEDPAAPDDDGEPQAGDEEDADTGGTASESGDTGASTTPSPAGDSGSSSSDSSSGDKALKALKISANDYPNLYDGVDIPDDLGCIMLDTEKIEVKKHVPDSDDDLVEQDDENKPPMGAVGETAPHVTLLDGLLENGNVWKDKVDALLKSWDCKSVTVDHVGSFDLGDKHAIVAHVVKSDELVEGHERLTLLPHVSTHSEYLPHVTLAYVKHDDAIRDKWTESLHKKHKGSTFRSTGLNYGLLPASTDPDHDGDNDSGSDDDAPAAPSAPAAPAAPAASVSNAAEDDTKCICCEGKGEHDTGFECYRCDASGLEKDAEGGVPCAGRADSDEVWVDEDGNYRHEEERGLKAPLKTQSIKHSTESKVDEDRKKTAKSKAELMVMHKEFVDLRDKVSNKYENDFMKVAHKQFEAQKAEVLKNVKSGFKSYKPTVKAATKAQKKKTDNLFDKTVSAAAWAAALTPIYKGAVVTAGNTAFNYVAAASTIGTSAQFSGADPDIIAFYEQRTTLVSVGIDDTTDRLLKTSLIEGISDGEDVASLMDRVESIYGAAAGYRALRIARTEAIDSTTFGTINAWEQSGVVSGKQWLVGSANPCPHCQSLDGKVMDLSKNFFEVGDSLTVGEGEGAQTMKFTYDNIDGPPLHPNCACSLVPILAS